MPDFTVTSGNAQLVIAALEPCINDDSLPVGLRTYYSEWLQSAREQEAVAPPPDLYVRCCEHTGLLFEGTYKGRGEGKHCVSFVSDMLRIVGFNDSKLKLNGACKEAAIASLAACRREGVTDPDLIQKRAWAAVNRVKQKNNTMKADIRPHREIAGTIIVDTRETRSQIHEQLQNRYGLTVELRELDAGDYRFVGEHATWLVERKQADQELIACIKDNRLFAQLQRMLNDMSVTHCFLLIEGNIHQRKLAFSDEALHGAMARIALLGVSIFSTRNAGDTADMLAALVRKAQEGQHPIRARANKEADPRLQQAQLLEALPGIGRERAQTLLDHFKTPGKVFAASVEELCGVKGVGKDRAQRIYAVIHKEIS